MKNCIWCSKSEDNASFTTKAHTIPKSLGGVDICENVCDECNFYFGRHNNKLPPIETVIKETFNISRARFLSPNNDIGKNKTLSKFSSIYFKVDFQKNFIDVKHTYKLQSHFQESICRQLKKGIYKMYLEEIERQFGDGHNPKYDFIREFARYDLGDYPLFYYKRTYGLILILPEWIRTPKLILDKELKMKYLVNEPSFSEFEFLGHVFGIVTSRYWQIGYDNYIKESINAKKEFFRGVKIVNKFNDIDLTLSILNDK